MYVLSLEGLEYFWNKIAPLIESARSDIETLQQTITDDVLSFIKDDTSIDTQKGWSSFKIVDYVREEGYKSRVWKNGGRFAIPLLSDGDTIAHLRLGCPSNTNLLDFCTAKPGMRSAGGSIAPGIASISEGGWHVYGEYMWPKLYPLKPGISVPLQYTGYVSGDTPYFQMGCYDLAYNWKRCLTSSTITPSGVCTFTPSSEVAFISPVIRTYSHGLQYASLMSDICNIYGYDKCLTLTGVAPYSLGAKDEDASNGYSLSMTVIDSTYVSGSPQATCSHCRRAKNSDEYNSKAFRCWFDDRVHLSFPTSWGTDLTTINSKLAALNGSGTPVRIWYRSSAFSISSNQYYVVSLHRSDGEFRGIGTASAIDPLTPDDYIDFATKKIYRTSSDTEVDVITTEDITLIPGVYSFMSNCMMYAEVVVDKDIYNNAMASFYMPFDEVPLYNNIFNGILTNGQKRLIFTTPLNKIVSYKYVNDILYLNEPVTVRGNKGYITDVSGTHGGKISVIFPNAVISVIPAPNSESSVLCIDIQNDTIFAVVPPNNTNVTLRGDGYIGIVFE